VRECVSACECVCARECVCVGPVGVCGGCGVFVRRGACGRALCGARLDVGALRSVVGSLWALWVLSAELWERSARTGTPVRSVRT